MGVFDQIGDDIDIGRPLDHVLDLEGADPGMIQFGRTTTACRDSSGGCADLCDDRIALFALSRLDVSLLRRVKDHTVPSRRAHAQLSLDLTQRESLKAFGHRAAIELRVVPQKQARNPRNPVRCPMLHDRDQAFSIGHVHPPPPRRTGLLSWGQSLRGRQAKIE